MRISSTALTLSSVLALVSAHKEPSSLEELERHRALQASAYHCAPEIAAYTAQRKRTAQQALGGNPSTDASTMFLDGAFEAAQDAGKTILECQPVEEATIRNHTCVLSPEVTQGPYYHVAGHPIRQNLAENQLGLLFLMDVGVMDVSTCTPVPNVLVDLWHANATGHYAGHADPDPALIWEGPAPSGKRKGLLTKFPRWNDVETWLRGAWPTNKNGVAQFTTITPGYYTGRATHVHVKIYTEWEPLSNGSFVPGRLVHTGQIMMEDDINEVVDKMWPYNTNPIKEKWGRTRNWDDSLNIYKDSHANGYLSTWDIQKLGGVFQQGLIGYITLGVDLSKDYDRTAAQQDPGVTHEK